MADLFADCGNDDDAEIRIKTDNPYAKKYDDWRRKEELMKAKARFGDDLESDSSDDEEEDEEADQWTADHEKNFLCTLSALKGRDPKIYKKDEILFRAADVPEKTKDVSAKPAKMTLKDYERKIVTEDGGVYADEDDEGHRSRIVEETGKDKLAYDQEQRDARKDFLEALGDSDADDGTDLLLEKKQSPTKASAQADEEEYTKWIKGETKRLANKKDAKNLESLRNFWSEDGNQNLDEAEKFLRDYVLNKRYITAKEEDFKFEVDFSEDEKDVEDMTEFEHKYNFRFEDPDPEFIKRYPRTIEDSMRRKDSRRSEKKAEKKTRKEKELTQYKEEVNRLKSFKKKEIIDKIEKLKNIAGSGEIAFDDKDLEDDFDPEEHDKRMAALFASYDDDQDGGEDEYPELGEGADEDLRWDDWDKFDKPIQEDQDSGESDGEQDAMDESNGHPMEGQQPSTADDAGVERDSEGKMIVRGRKSAKLTLEDILPEKKEKKRKKSKFAQVLMKDRPEFDPERDETFEKYFDEYYKLDFEDMVGGMPTRFKYRQVAPNDFGLSTDEVLKAKDKELNKWCSLKKMVQYRSKAEESEDFEKFSKRKDHLNLKKKILTSVYTAPEERIDSEIAEKTGQPESEAETKKKSRSRKNKKKKTPQTAEDDRVDAGDDENIDDPSDNIITTTSETAKEGETKKRNKKRKVEVADTKQTEADALESGERPMKAKRPKQSPADGSLIETSVHREATTAGETTAEENGEKSLANVPWDKLTPKQKKNRRNAMTKKRKKQVFKQQLDEKIKSKKEKFKPFEELQMSAARMKAYGLDPNRVKGELVYGKDKKAKKQKNTSEE